MIEEKLNEAAINLIILKDSETFFFDIKIAMLKIWQDGYNTASEDNRKTIEQAFK